MKFGRIPALVALLALSACESGSRQSDAVSADGKQARGPGASELAPPADDDRSTTPYSAIAEDDLIHFVGTEPFWAGEVHGATLTYSTPKDQDGTEIAVARFAGRGGLSFSGELDQQSFEMMLTPLTCSDGMSDRTYPLTVTLKLGDEMRNGCAWTDRHPFEGPAQP